MGERTGPLQDVVIVDCTMALSGPFGTAMLADLGADVIKVESPKAGARLRKPYPPDYAVAASEEPAGVDHGGFFESINRNKRSIVLDLKNERDQETFLLMCEQADAVVENMRPGVMDGLGIGYDVIRERNPAIVYGCIRGFGDPRTGESPYADWPAFDMVAQAMGGLVHVNGPEDDPIGFPCGVSVGDIYPGTLLALGVVSAIHHAKATGEGQFFDVAMYDAMLALCETLIVNYSYPNGRSLGPTGRKHTDLTPFGIYPCKDGAVALAAPGGGQHWEVLALAMGREDLIAEERTTGVTRRETDRAFIEDIVTAWTQARTKAEIMEHLGGLVPCGPVNSAADIFDDPHVAARGMLAKIQLPGDNPEVAVFAPPIKFTKTKTSVYRRAPNLGEHRDEVLRQFGLDGDER
ncbi:MAG: CoA transferase [Pseudomonadota bacterium]